MPFENEFASYEPLRRIVNSPRVQELERRLRIRRPVGGSASDLPQGTLVRRADLPNSTWLPKMILAIDGSRQAQKAENGFPGAEYGYVTVASVLLLMDKIMALAHEKFIDPKLFRETEKAAAIDGVFPGANVMVDGEKSAKASFRRMLFEQLQSVRVFESGETLLDTYEALLKIKIDADKNRPTRAPQSPLDGVEDDMIYSFGQYTDPTTQEPLYSTDATRLHELMNPMGSNEQLYTQVMSMLEKLWLIHILRAFEQKGWIPTLREVVFVLDGPLACFSTWSWLNRSIILELKRINTVQKAVNNTDLIVLGIEKSGVFWDHFAGVDTSTSGVEGEFPTQAALLLDDAYIKSNIVFSQGGKPYGEDTYFGRKFFYKTKSGHRLVPVLAGFEEAASDLSTAEPRQFTRLADVMNILDELASSKYPNSVSPLIAAHAEAAIPLHLGKQIFEDIAREIRQNSTS